VDPRCDDPGDGDRFPPRERPGRGRGDRYPGTTSRRWRFDGSLRSRRHAMAARVLSVEGTSPVGDGKETSSPAAPDSCSALIPSGAPVGAPLLDPGDTKRALTREMLARCLHRSKRSVEHAIVVGAAGEPATGRPCLQMAKASGRRRAPRATRFRAVGLRARCHCWLAPFGAARTDHRPRPAENAGAGEVAAEGAHRCTNSPHQVRIFNGPRLVRIEPPRPRWAWSSSGHRSAACGGGSRMTTLQLILAAEQVIARLLAIPAAALTARKHLSRGNVDRTPGPETTVSGPGPSP
jgi:hypothetical protein